MKNQAPEQENKTQNQSQPVAVSTDGKNVNTIRVDSRIIPIYPVRYAYANFFEEELSEAVEPPELKSFMGAPDIKTTNGYIIRLLREGWVYIREEDDPANGQFHIFKYERIVDKEGKVTERFPKYTFKNRINAQDGTELDRSGQRPEGYPFVFVSSKAKKISIVYSEHEWHPDVIDKLHSSESERRQSMQLIDLEAETDTHSVKADAANLGQIVEDYRERQDRLLKLKESIGSKGYAKESELDQEDLAVLTTEKSYEMDTDDIAFEVRKQTARNKNAKIVALFDPVGRQQEIAYAHAKLVTWQQYAYSKDIYPFTIGHIVDQMRAKPLKDDKKKAEKPDEKLDKKIQKILKKSINWEDHDTYWQEMNQEQKAFEYRQEQLALIYKAFMHGAATTGKVGSLDTYFKAFFTLTPGNGHPALEEEFQKLCKVNAPIYAGMLASPKGKETIEKLLAHAAEQSDLKSTRNATAVFLKSLRIMLTNPQARIEWGLETVKALDKSLKTIGPVLGEGIALFKNGIEKSPHKIKSFKTQLTAKAVTLIVEKLMPGILKVYGLKLDTAGVLISDNAMGRITKKLTTSAGKEYEQAMDALEKYQKRAWRGQKLFDWASRKKTGAQQAWKLLKIEELSDISKMKHRKIKPRVKLPEKVPGVPHGIGILADSSFAGISVLFNVSVICDVMMQTETRFAKADPIHKGSGYQTMFKFTAAATSLAIDLMALTKAGAKGYVKAAPHTRHLANALVPRANGLASTMTRILAGRIGNSLIAIANLAGAIASCMDAYNAFRIGNKGQATGHLTIAAASAIISFQAGHKIYHILRGTTRIAGRGGWIGLAALVLIGLGAFIVYWFSKSDFQILLENCFWGKGKKYVFWTDRKTRPPIKDRLEMARDIHQDIQMMTYYQMELFEFMNYFYMPKLEIDKKIYRPDEPGMQYPAMLKYTFTLPGFQPGVSQIEANTFHLLYPRENPSESNARRSSLPEYAHQLQEKIHSMQDHQMTFINGAAVISVEIKAIASLQLEWLYKPQPGIIVPMRLLTKDGLRKENDVVCGMINEELV